MAKLQPTLNQADIDLLLNKFSGVFATKNDLTKAVNDLKKEVKNMIEDESALQTDILIKYFEEVKLDTHEPRIKALEMEVGIAPAFN